MDALANALRMLAERNQKTRVAFMKMTTRVNEITLSGTMDELNEFNNSLEGQLREILEGPWKDPAVGGTDSSSRHEREGSTEPTQ